MKLLQRSIAAATMAGLFALAGNAGKKASPPGSFFIALSLS
jgi:hypothetical protein